ncbi:MAG: cysteine desulfurase [Caldilineaceae bacterium]
MTTPSLDSIRADFPILNRQVNSGKPLVYFDNGATSQKPNVVLTAMDNFYRCSNANVHRGVHTLSEEATALFENARKQVAHFINAAHERQVIFTKGTTEGINLVANSWGRANLQPGDEVLITQMEHHANIVPWHLLQSQIGFTLRFVPITPAGMLDMEALPELLTERTKLFAFTHISNVLGTINPAAELVQMAHAVGAKVLIDGAQSVPHIPVDVQALDVDFLVFSGHKMCGPTGIGGLYGKRELLESMPPFLGGGSMIRQVTMHGSTFLNIPQRFEAGTPAIAEAIGLGAAADYLSKLGMEWVAAHNHALAGYAYEQLSELEGVRILGPEASKRTGIVSFTMQEVHPHDISAILDAEGVAVRAGHHCAQPLHDFYGIPASARASFYVYNTKEEVDQLVKAVGKASEIFA